ncbi:c-type cytochrome [Roseateles violae]|uniref:Cytochrome c n=1 Tax=Roseateles violae TaxID=3058042 RepID=A0ABT8DRD4_9BURK|nr:cytochrome c [Pelomonas sp. PFR6]MDN3919605.1 cytochrome c [Pelomonas sp. PFR6]
MMKQTLFALACAAGICAPAHAQFQKPEDAIKYRQAAFTLMGNHFGRIAAMAQGKAPFDAKAAAANAEIVLLVSKLPYSAFGEGTDLGNTKAKPEIWKEAPKFREAAEKMQAEVVKLDAAAKSGSLDQIKVAVGEVGKSCKACHDNYREK